MKKLLLICLFCLSSFLLTGQYASDCFTYKKPFKQSKIPESVKVIGIYTTSILFDAIGDGFNDEGKKELGHVFNAMSVGVLLASPFVINYEKSKWGYYLTSYVALRISMFDPTYNVTRGLPVTYIGGTSLWDKGLSYMKPADGFLMGRSVSLSLGIAIPIKEFDNSKKRYRRYGR